jgi:hypothetical protein
MPGGVLSLVLALLLSTAESAAARCAGDCDGNGRVEIHEVIGAISCSISIICLFEPHLRRECLDLDDSGTVSINELIAVVNSALVGCPPAEGCRDSGDCAAQPGALCIEPGGFVGCGICQPLEDECADDAGCGVAGMVCVVLTPPPCACSGSVLVCRPGCRADQECGAGEGCDGDGHCRARRCAQPGDCPPQFGCDAVCGRLPCAGDADCDPGGFCVLGDCYDALGTCQAVPP